MPKKRTTLTLPDGLREEAAEYKVNMSEAAEEGIAAALKKAKEAAWKRDNKDVIDSLNAYVREHGLPLARYRQF